MGAGSSILLVFLATFVGVVVVVWLLFSLLWYLGGRVGRATGVSARVDRLLDPNGLVLPDEVRIMDDGGFREGIGGL
jgi:hypothetical protein